MRDFIFNVSTKILFGRDQMKNLASEFKKIWVKSFACLWWRLN